MSASDVLPSPAGTPPAGAAIPATRLAVAWQHRDRTISPVGLLEFNGESYRFYYTQNMRQVSGFRPFIGFPKTDIVYESNFLFPLFQQRVMDPRRPDFPRYTESLDLPRDATPWEQLARSQGRRNGDTIMLFPEPVGYPDGTTSYSFLVHGIRHAADTPEEVEARLARLNPGDELALEPEPANPVNPDALIITSDGDRIGWMPNLLLPYVHEVRRHGAVALRAQHINGPATPPHLRVLANLKGTIAPDYRGFSGDLWAPARL